MHSRLHPRLALLAITALALGSIAPALHALEDADAGMVAHWRFDGDLMDASGNGHHATVIGGVGFTTDSKVGDQAMMLAGTGGAVIPTGSDLPSDLFTATVTISGWLKTDGGESDVEGFISRRQNDTQFQFVSGVAHGGTVSGTTTSMQDGSFVFIAKTQVGNKTGILSLSSGTVLVDDNQWHHVAITYEPGVSARLYVDGILIDSVNNPDPIWAPSAVPQTAIGSAKFNGENPLDGSVDEVRIYNRSLSVNEIAAASQGDWLQDFQGMAKDHQEIDLAWEAKTDLPESWHIERSLDTTFSSLDAVIEVPGDTFFHRDLTAQPQTSYFYRVRPVVNGVLASPEGLVNQSTTPIRTIPIEVDGVTTDHVIYSQFIEDGFSVFGQDRSTAVQEAGNGMLLGGNAWKQVLIGHEVTAQTVLEFTYQPHAIGEVGGIAPTSTSDMNLIGNDLFQLTGTQIWGMQHLLISDPSDQAYTFRIPLIFYRQSGFDRLVFVSDQDAAGADPSATISGIRIYDDPNLGLPALVDGELQILPVTDYSPENKTINGVDFLSDGISIRGNNWKKARIDYTISEETMVSFDLSSDSIGEVHGIAFGNGDSYSELAMFQIDGTQVWENDLYRKAISGPGVTISLPVGTFLAGRTFSHMIIVCDHDVSSASAHTQINNIQIYSQDPMLTISTGQPATASDALISPFSPQDAPTLGGNLKLDGGTAELTGNLWKKVSLGYAVTESTTLEFDISSTSQSEVHAIGLCNGDTAEGMAVFQIDGSQFWGTQGSRTTLTQSPIRISIPVGQHVQGSFSHLLLINDNDATATTGQTIFSNIHIYEGAAPQSSLLVEINSIPTWLPVSTFTPQDAPTSGSATLTDGSIRLLGNLWKKMDMDSYTIYPDTELTFNISSNSIPEVIGIGFCNGDSLTGHHLFQIDGTQYWGNQDHRTSTDAAPITITIPVGQHLDGKTFSHLLIANDHDVLTPTGSSTFSSLLLGPPSTPYNN